MTKFSNRMIGFSALALSFVVCALVLASQVEAVVAPVTSPLAHPVVSAPSPASYVPLSAKPFWIFSPRQVFVNSRGVMKDMTLTPIKEYTTVQDVPLNVINNSAKGLTWSLYQSKVDKSLVEMNHMTGSLVIKDGVSISKNTVVLGPQVPTGKYQFKVCTIEGDYCEMSAPFKIRNVPAPTVVIPSTPPALEGVSTLGASPEK